MRRHNVSFHLFPDDTQIFLSFLTFQNLKQPALRWKIVLKTLDLG